MLDLVAPYLRKKIDSFENEPVIDAFRDAVKKAAEEATAVHTFSLMGNSYGAQFFKELAPFVEKLPSIQVAWLLIAETDHQRHLHSKRP
jgi:hypothetical protein